MNNNPLQTEFSKFDKLQAELAELRTYSETTIAWRASQERTCDLSDKAALAEIGRLQVLTGLLPGRIAAREEALIQAEADLLLAAHSFIRETLGPQARQLLSHTREKIKPSLQPLYSDADELEKAIEKTDTVQQADQLLSAVRIDMNPIEGTVEYVRRMLAILKKIESFTEKTA
jgi:hypothetical protein